MRSALYWDLTQCGLAVTYQSALHNIPE